MFGIHGVHGSLSSGSNLIIHALSSRLGSISHFVTLGPGFGVNHRTLHTTGKVVSIRCWVDWLHTRVVPGAHNNALACFWSVRLVLTAAGIAQAAEGTEAGSFATWKPAVLANVLQVVWLDGVTIRGTGHHGWDHGSGGFSSGSCLHRASARGNRSFIGTFPCSLRGVHTRHSQRFSDVGGFNGCALSCLIACCLASCQALAHNFVHPGCIDLVAFFSLNILQGC
mmetsp:Transcript_24449/g.53305  ORF Transcript_24449/g.53305 Transcript_24449/m.53305 type:complete len:225 (+) Transcript_24449:2023-2697(+)